MLNYGRLLARPDDASCIAFVLGHFAWTVDGCKGSEYDFSILRSCVHTLPINLELSVCSGHVATVRRPLLNAKNVHVSLLLFVSSSRWM